MENLSISIGKAELEKMMGALMENAFELMHQEEVYAFHNKNPFIEIFKGVIAKNREEIERAMGDYLMEIVKGDDFKDAVRVEYTAMLARAMLEKLQK